MIVNRSSRPRVVDTAEIARDYRRVFTQKDVRKEIELPFTWPSTMQHVGESLGVAYASDKWKQDGDFELYLHVAESRNRALCVPGFLAGPNGRAWPSVGPMVSFIGMPMPKHITFLAFFEEVRLRLHTGTDEKPKLGDDSVYVVRMKHGMLGCGKIRWTLDGKSKDEPFLVVYTERRGGDRGGVHMIIVGDELDVEGDGIVG